MFPDILQLNSSPNPEPIEAAVEALRGHLSPRGLSVEDVGGAGDCMFHAVSRQLQIHTGQVISPSEIRLQAVQYLIDHPHTVSITDYRLYST